MQRRDLLRSTTALLGGASLSGCLDAFGSESAWRDLVIDRPDEIYAPPKVDGMLVCGTVEAEGYALLLSATRPHRFWTVTGTETNQTAMREAHSMHLMVSVWEPDSHRHVPAEVAISIDRGGETRLDRTLWPMLSQRMGVHHGDNIALPEPGIYGVTIRVFPLDIGYAGAFDGGFDPGAFEIEIEYDPSEIEGLDRTVLEESRRGRPGAVEPMGHDHDADPASPDHSHGGRPPVPTAPPPEAFPGVIDEVETGDYRTLVATADHGAGRYLIVSPRTRYNGFPLPRSSLSARIDRGGAGTDSVSLIEATHPTVGHHYGAVVDPLTSGDALGLSIETPPQLARHEGYETAFFDRPEVSLRVPR